MRIMRRAQWFLINLPIAWAVVGVIVIGGRVEARALSVVVGWKEWVGLYAIGSSVAHDRESSRVVWKFR